MWKFGVVVAVAAVYLCCTRDTFDPDSLSGRNILITGASRGIGKALAIQCARFGANVMLTARNEAALKEVGKVTEVKLQERVDCLKVVEECKTIGRANAKFGYIVGDMAQFDTVPKKIVEVTLKTLGPLDQVILNHAILPGKAADWQKWKGTQTEQEFLDRAMLINFKSHVYMADHVIPHLRESKGKLGVISSTAAKMPAYGSAAYAASKRAFDGFFRTLSHELRFDEHPVPVTICTLGFIGTEDIDNILNNLIDNLGFDATKIKPLLPVSDLNETVIEIIRATTKGEKELYFPSSAWWMGLMHHIWPDLFEVDVKPYLKED